MSERGDRILFGSDERTSFWHVELEKLATRPDPLVMVVAPTGGTITREQNPNQPYLAEEITRQVVAAYEKGCQVHHFHVRDEKGFGSERIEDYLRLHTMVSDQCPGMTVSLNLTRPFDDDSIEVRYPMEKLDLGDSVIVNMGSMNVGPKVFRNSENFILDACRFLEARGKKPELAVYNQRMLADVSETLIAQGAVTPPYFINLCMGIHSAIPATIPNLFSMVELLPDDAVWLLTVGGRNWLPMMSTAIALGGHVRVGMEDNVYYYNDSNELIDDCGKCIDKIVKLADAMGRPVATREETRKILGLENAREAVSL
jgi:3-keto-5-aminohexanoate cleavage enzyme